MTGRTNVSDSEGGSMSRTPRDSDHPENDTRALLQDVDWLQEQIMLHGTPTAVARAHGLPERTVRDRAQKIRLLTAAGGLSGLQPTIAHSDLMSEITLTGGGVVAADWHIPMTNWNIVRRMVDDAIKYGLTRWLGIPGDFLNMDALSDHYPKQDGANLESELEQASQVIDMLLDVFDEIIIAKGNHDVRLLKALGYKMRFEHSMKMVLDIDRKKLERVRMTGRDYFLVDTPQGIWRCCHTRQYARNQLSIPSQIADINQQHVAGAHRHHCSVGKSPSGKWVVELGGLHDASRTEYLVQWTTTYPKWANGYMLLSDQGEPYLPLLAPAPVLLG